MLPTPAFKKLSGMKSLAGVLAGLAQKFDATAFLWLLLQRWMLRLRRKPLSGCWDMFCFRTLKLTTWSTAT